MALTPNSSTPNITKDTASDVFKPDGIKAPRLMVIVLLTKSGGFEDAIVRVSHDVLSAHDFAKAFTLNEFPFLYTDLEGTGISRPPLPGTVYLALAQKKAWDLRSAGLGLFQTLEAAKDGCRVMAAKDAGFTSFGVKTCPVQLGLSEEDDEYLEMLMDRGIAHQMAKEAKKTANGDEACTTKSETVVDADPEETQAQKGGAATQ